MPDITLCTNNECFYRRRCARYTTPPDPVYQSFQRFEPYQKFDDTGALDAFTCEMNMIDFNQHDIELSKKIFNYNAESINNSKWGTKDDSDKLTSFVKKIKSGELDSFIKDLKND
jgi:hypothetical protein